MPFRFMVYGRRCINTVYMLGGLLGGRAADRMVSETCRIVGQQLHLNSCNRFEHLACTTFWNVAVIDVRWVPGS